MTSHSSRIERHAAGNTPRIAEPRRSPNTDRHHLFKSTTRALLVFFLFPFVIDKAERRRVTTPTPPLPTL